MALLIGTDAGVYRVDEVPFEEADTECVLDRGPVTSLRRFPHRSEAFATTTQGAFRTEDSRQWEDLAVPLSDSGSTAAWSVLATVDGGLYVGTNDPYLYRSVDDGATWNELRGFRELRSRGQWESPSDPHYARVRALESVPGRPDHLVVGIEAGGVHVSRDGGDNWIDRREATPTDDIHDLVVLDEDVYLAATGHLDLRFEHLGVGHAVGPGGLYRTADGGDSWTRLDRDNPFTYVRRVFLHDGTLYFSGAREHPPMWDREDHDAGIFESTDFGRTFERVSYPGRPEVVDAWTAIDGTIYCGAGFYSPRETGTQRGRLLRRGSNGYETVGRLPGGVFGIVEV